MMALVFKFPVDRPPFFGIKFDNEREAEQTNKFFPRNKDHWTASIEVEGVRIHVTIQSIPYQHKHTYTIYEWDRKALMQFLSACKNHQQVTFGHVAKVGDDLKVAHWSMLGYAWWIKINKIDYRTI